MPAPAGSFAPPTLTPTAAPPAARSTVERPSLATANPIPGPARFRLRDAFPFHWADLVAPVDAPGNDRIHRFPDPVLPASGNPYRVARNLVISNLTFAVGGAIPAGLLNASSFVEEGETTGSVRIDLSIGFPVFGLLFAAVSFVIFVALSKARAKRELQSHMETV